MRIEELRSYTHKNAERPAYPDYKSKGYQIYSGAMESFCKQLGQPMKGTGMQWNINNVTVIVTLVSLWANDELDHHWKTVAKPPQSCRIPHIQIGRKSC